MKHVCVRAHSDRGTVNPGVRCVYIASNPSTSPPCTHLLLHYHCRGCTAGRQDADGNTHLHAAASGAADSPELVQALLALGVPPNAANRSGGDTALHVAARAGHVEVRALLLPRLHRLRACCPAA